MVGEFNQPGQPSGSMTNVLMVVAVIAVVVAGINIFATTNALGELTGHASDDTGTATVELEAAVHIQFTVNAIDWGSGSVNTNPATLDTVTSPNYYDANWTAASGDAPSDNGLTGGLELENYGSVDVDLDLYVTEDADTFVCSSDSECVADGNQAFNYQLENAEVDSCPVGEQLTGAWSAWTSFPTTATTICDGFSNAGTSNLIEIDLQLVVPITAPVGETSNTITAEAQVST